MSIFDIAKGTRRCADMPIPGLEFGVAPTAALDGNRTVLMRPHGIAITVNPCRPPPFVPLNRHERAFAGASNRLGASAFLQEEKIEGRACQTDHVMIDRAWDLRLEEVGSAAP